MIHVGTLIEFKSGIQYEVIKVFNQRLVDLKAIKPQFEWMPDYLPIYLSIQLKNYKILSVPSHETPKVRINKQTKEVCEHTWDFKQYWSVKVCTKCGSRRLC